MMSDLNRLRAMALGFGLGSALFALGTVLVWLSGSEVTVNVTFALGAAFFTAAAFIQWRTAVATRRVRAAHRRKLGKP